MSARQASVLPSPLRHRLVDAASAPYRSAGRFAWHFARGKLKGDPAFQAMLARGLVPDGQRILDLGCGQGLLAAWLQAARSVHDAGEWPADVPAPPRIVSYNGIELMDSDVARARAAFGTAPGGPAGFAAGDIRSAGFGRAHAVVILDVLHYIDIAAQDAVLTRVHAALESGGVLLLRVGDADGGLPFRISTLVDRVVTFARGHRMGQLHCRALSAWMAALAKLGFAVDPLPMSAGTPFSNVLLVARKG